MTVRGAESPPALRLVHAAVFCLFASAAFGLSLPELEHLVTALSGAFHSGDAPRPASIAGALLAGLGMAVILIWLLRSRSAPLWASGLVLVGLCLALTGAMVGVPQARSPAGANLTILKTAQSLQARMVQVLQGKGEVPRALDAWGPEFKEAAVLPSPVRRRNFDGVPFALAQVPEKDAVPAALTPGLVLVWVSPDGAAFELRAVGFDGQGVPAVLTDDKGEVLALTGTYNPELPPPELPRLPGAPAGP